MFHISEFYTHSNKPTYPNPHDSPSLFVHTHTHTHTHKWLRWWFVAVMSTCGPIASAKCHTVVSHRTDNGEVKGRVWARGCWGVGRSGTLANWLMSRGREAGQRGVTQRHDIIESPWDEAGGEGEDRDMPPGMPSGMVIVHCLLCTIYYPSIFVVHAKASITIAPYSVRVENHKSVT